MKLLVHLKRFIFDKVFWGDNFIIPSLAILALSLIWIAWRKRSEYAPPGSNGIPLLGKVLSLRGKPERVMAQWNKQYGPVCMVKMGFTDVVVLGSYEAINEAFVKSDSFSNRPSTLEVFNDGFGLLLVDANHAHKVQRKFTLNTLREFGMGKRSFEHRLLAITRCLCLKIEAMCTENNHKSKPFAFDLEIYESVASVISQMVFGFDLPQENPEFKKLLLKMIEPNKYNALSGILMFAPSLKYLPGFSKIASMAKIFTNQLKRFIKIEVESHLETFHSARMRDFIDRFLEKMIGKQFLTPNRRVRKRSSRSPSPKAAQRARRDSDSNNNLFKSLNRSDRPSTPKYGNFLTVPKRAGTSSRQSKRRTSSNKKTPKPLPHQSFNFDQLVSLVRDLFIAAVDTTSSTLSWVVFFLCCHPEVQAKVAEEIESVIGQDGVPTMSMREKLPYVLAVIQETFRVRPPVPLAVPHFCSHDSLLMGYRIPKGAVILSNLWAVHLDETRWKNPHDFIPERHLRNGAFVKSPYVIPFGMGARHCVGQQLANMEVFICVVGLMQRFRFSFVDGSKPDIAGESMVVLRPYPFDITATVR